MKKIITLLTAAAIVFDLFTPLRLYFEGGKALSMLIPTVLILIYDVLFVRKTFLPIGLYILVCALLMVMGCEYFSIPEFITYFFAYACFEHFLVSRDHKFAKTVLVTLYLTIMVTVLMSIPLFIAMPNLSRLMIDAEENGIKDGLLFWTIQYPTIHALPVYSIPLFYLVKTGRVWWLKILSLISILAILLLMFYADATAALLLTLGVYAVLIIYDPQKTFRRNGLRLGFVGVFLLLFLNKSVLIGILRASQFIFEGSSTYHKIDEMILSLSGQGVSGDLEAREEKIVRSWNSFLSNPLFPEMNVDNIGQHNFLIDQIVVLGLIPGITFIWFLVERIKRPLKYLNAEALPYYFLCVVTLLAMGFTKNFFLLFPTCCVAPMFFMLCDTKFKKRI